MRQGEAYYQQVVAFDMKTLNGPGPFRVDVPGLAVSEIYFRNSTGLLMSVGSSSSIPDDILPQTSLNDGKQVQIGSTGQVWLFFNTSVNNVKAFVYYATAV